MIIGIISMAVLVFFCIVTIVITYEKQRDKRDDFGFPRTRKRR